MPHEQRLSDAVAALLSVGARGTTPPQRTAIHDPVTKKLAVRERTNHKEQRAGDHRDGSVTPGVAPNQGRGQTEDCQPDARLAADAALGALVAAALAPKSHLLGEPRVGENRQPDQGDDDTDDERNRFDTHLGSL